jgi:hypothetical protein
LPELEDVSKPAEEAGEKAAEGERTAEGEEAAGEQKVPEVAEAK